MSSLRPPTPCGGPGGCHDDDVVYSKHQPYEHQLYDTCAPCSSWHIRIHTCAHICMCAHICICMCTHMCIHMYMHTHYACKCTHMCIHMYMHTHICLWHIRIHTYVRTLPFLRNGAYTHTHTYVHAYTHTGMFVAYTYTHICTHLPKPIHTHMCVKAHIPIHTHMYMVQHTRPCT